MDACQRKIRSYPLPGGTSLLARFFLDGENAWDFTFALPEFRLSRGSRVMLPKATDWLVEFERVFYAARDGDDEAAALFLARYRKMVRHWIRRYMKSRVHSIMDLDDLEQEVYEKIFAERFADEVAGSPSKLLAYLRRTATHTAIDFNRKYLNAEKRDLRRESHFSNLPDGWDADV